MTVSIGTQRKIPWSPPLLEKEEQEAAINVIRSGWMTQGKQTAAFEQEIAASSGAKYAVAVNNGTSALIAALLVHGIGYGDEVLVPTFTFIATVNAVLAVGAKPILVDCDPKTFNIGPVQLAEKLTQKTKALVFVDVYGMSCDIDALTEFSNQNKLVLIEDAAEAIGAQYKGRPIGSFSHTAILSFHMAKLVPTVEGGCILTQNEEIAVKLRQIRNHGMAGQYHYVTFGLNLRTTDIQAALGREQLKKLTRIVEHRQRLVALYKEGLKDLVSFQEIPSYATVHPHMIFSVFLSSREARDKINKYLTDHGIDTRIAWVPAHLQPYHQELFASQGAFPNSEGAAEGSIALPLGNALTPDEVEIAIRVFREGARQA